MRYLSVCSGIEAASVAWRPLGWDPVAFSEIGPFPCAALRHHYPDTPNWGDMNGFKEWPRESVDVLVGGTPCQSFSVAGLRRGLDDPRGNLMLVYLAILASYRPRWMVWENVPGVLSSNRGRDFGTFLGALGQLGYGWAYRILDAQYLGVPQRRRRVFVVGYLGDWRYPGAVLSERQSLSGYPPPSAGTGSRVAAGLTRGADSGGKGGYAGRRREDDENVVVCGQCQGSGVGPIGALRKSNGAVTGGVPFVAAPLTRSPYADNESRETLLVPTVAHALTAQKTASHRMDPSGETFVTHSLRGEGFDASEDGTGRGTPLVFAQNSRDEVRYVGGDGQLVGALAAETGSKQQSYIQHNGVRRLTPRECERLQGLPDDYTLVPYNGKPAKDSPRYQAIGNSIAVPVLEWIGRRIDAADPT